MKALSRSSRAVFEKKKRSPILNFSPDARSFLRYRALKNTEEYSIAKRRVLKGCIPRLLERVYCKVFGDIRAQVYICKCSWVKFWGKRRQRCLESAMTFVRVLPTNPSDDDLKRTTLAKERALRAEDIERLSFIFAGTIGIQRRVVVGFVGFFTETRSREKGPRTQTRSVFSGSSCSHVLASR